VGLGRNGEPFTFAVNVFSDSEFCGACFSPDGDILFTNIQGGNANGSGMTLAITGPWRRGPLYAVPSRPAASAGRDSRSQQPSARLGAASAALFFRRAGPVRRLLLQRDYRL
jgi:secreted PhoX family phosphatase